MFGLLAPLHVVTVNEGGKEERLIPSLHDALNHSRRLKVVMWNHVLQTVRIDIKNIIITLIKTTLNI